MWYSQANNSMKLNRRETELHTHDHIIYEKDILCMELELHLRSKCYMLGIRAKFKQTKKFQLAAKRKLTHV